MRGVVGLQFNATRRRHPFFNVSVRVLLGSVFGVQRSSGYSRSLGFRVSGTVGFRVWGTVGLRVRVTVGFRV